MKKASDLRFSHNWIYYYPFFLWIVSETTAAIRIRDIEDSTFRFSERVIKMVRTMLRDMASRGVDKQLARSGTVIDANSVEAQSSQFRIELAR